MDNYDITILDDLKDYLFKSILINERKLKNISSSCLVSSEIKGELLAYEKILGFLEYLEEAYKVFSSDVTSDLSSEDINI